MEDVLANPAMLILAVRRNEVCAFRFKPVQKFDSSSGENYSGGGQHHPGAAEQTVIAQSQHHQQFIGPFSFNPGLQMHRKIQMYLF